MKPGWFYFFIGVNVGVNESKLLTLFLLIKSSYSFNIYIYIYINSYIWLTISYHFILLWLNPFDLRVDRKGLWLGPSCVIVPGLLVRRGCLKRFLALAISTTRWGSLTMALTGKFVYMAHHFILLWLNPFELRVDMERWWLEHSFVIVAGLLVRRGY